MTTGDRVNVASQIRSANILRNAVVVGEYVDSRVGTPMLVLAHRSERFPVAVPASQCSAYVPRSRTVAASDRAATLADSQIPGHGVTA